MTPQEITEKWLWMMNWCRSLRLPPANTEVWNMAERAYTDFQSTLTRHATVDLARTLYNK